MARIVYVLYGMLVFGALGVAEYRGWSMTRVMRVENVPRSVRDNPGNYRPVYGGVPRSPGGK